MPSLLDISRAAAMPSMPSASLEFDDGDIRTVQFGQPDRFPAAVGPAADFVALIRQPDLHGPGDQGVVFRNDQTGFVIHIWPP